MQNNPVVSIYPVKGHTGIIGTGTFISSTIILTCEHVVKKSKTVNAIVWYNEGISKKWNKLVHIKASVLYTCKSLDFALLEVDEPFTPMPLGLEAPLNSDIKIVCPHEKASPYTGTITYNSGLATKLERVSYTIEGSVLVPGTSGSPLVYQNKLVGLHWSVGSAREDRKKSFSVPFKFIYEKLQKEFGFVSPSVKQPDPEAWLESNADAEDLVTKGLQQAKAGHLSRIDDDKTFNNLI